MAPSFIFENCLLILKTISTLRQESIQLRCTVWLTTPSISRLGCRDVWDYL